MEEKKTTKEANSVKYIKDAIATEATATTELGYSGVEKPVLHGAKFGRSYELAKKEIQLSLFSQSLEENQKAIEKGQKAPYVLIIGSKVSGISLLSIKRVDHALREILYDQSYLSGNLDQNTGLARDGELLDSVRIPPETIDGQQYFVAEIKVKLHEIASRAFGKNTNDTRKQTLKVLEAFQEGITARNTFKDEKTRSMLWIKGRDYEAKTKELVLDLVLHPLFAKDVKNSFALHKHGLLNLIGRPTDTKLDLLTLLGIQDKRYPYIIYLSTLLEKLNLLEAYKKNKSRTIADLDKAINSMVNCGILSQPPVIEQNHKGDIMKFTFTLNPDYAKG